MSLIDGKRTQDKPEDPVPPKSKAAKFNIHTLKKLEKALSRDPEIDLSSQMRIEYSDRLVRMREYSQIPHSQEATKPVQTDIRDHIDTSSPAEVVFPLSEIVVRLLQEVSSTAAPLPESLTQRLLKLLQISEVLWNAPFSGHKIVLKCASNVAVKVVHDLDDSAEYTTLQFLELYKPTIPAPKPLGFVRINNISLIFMSYAPSTTLEKVWHGLDRDQKASIQNQLNRILSELRSIPYDNKLPFGGVAAEGCKDVRRDLRRSEKPIVSIPDFEDFLFSAPHHGGDVLIKMLRELSPLSLSPSSNIVFTHGDLRPANIAVEIVDSQYMVSGLLDWEYSGFYPEYWEAIRSTNCLAPCEANDWYLYLPDCVAPKRYAQWWLLDRVRELIFL